MDKAFLIIFGALLLLGMAATPSLSLNSATKVGNQNLCPVMGFEIDRELFTDYNEHRVYFCCPSCPPEFKQTPAKYMAKMRDQGITLESSPA